MTVAGEYAFSRVTFLLAGNVLWQHIRLQDEERQT